MKVAVFQSGSTLSSGLQHYSITTRRQVDSLNSVDGVKVKVFLVTNRTNPIGFIRNYYKLKNEINHFKPIVIHSHYGSMVGLMASLIAFKYKIKFIVSYCGDDLFGSSNSGLLWVIRNRLMILISHLVSFKANHIHVKSQSLFNALSRSAKKKASIIPNGVNSTFFSPKGSNWIIAKSEEKCSKNEMFKIFFNASSGSNQAVKNIALAKATIDELKLLEINSELSIVGNATPSEFKDKLLSSNCLLLTSFHEGSPNVVKEALACNIPVVSVDCGDVKELLLNVNKGGVVSEYDEHLLAQKVKEVLGNDEYFNGRDQFIKMGLDEKNIAQRIIGLYHSVQTS